MEVFWWFLATFLVLWLLIREGNLRNYGRNWRQQPSLLVFLAICTLSVFWSGNQTVTVFRSLVLIMSTWVAAYIGMRCNPKELLHYLSWFGVGIVVASMCMVLADPSLGMNRYYGPGVWRGIFWNKNHLGSISALCSALLFLRLVDMRAMPVHATKAFFMLIYFGSLVVVYKSHSAAGYLLVLIVHATVFLSLLWIRYAKHLGRRHYIYLSVSVILLTAVLLTNLDIIFGALGRSSTLTGRTDLWAYLLEDIVSRKPFLGYGFGSLWGDPHFRLQIYEKIGWNQPVIGDNGFMDILLGVGTIGLAACMMVFFAAWKGTIGCIVREKSVASCLPPLVMLFAFFSNISFSLLTEIEVMVWGLIVVILFMTSERTVHLRCRDGTLINRR
jgi:O-antigen ligase